MGGRGGRPRCGRAVLALLALLPASCAARDAGTGAGETGPESTVQVADTLLARRMDLLAARSATWRAGMESLRRSGFRVVVALPEQVPGLVPGLQNYAAMHLGEVLPIRETSGTLVGAVVTVDVRRLQRLASDAQLPQSMVATDVDRILIHEIYGHVVPLAQSRSVAGGCPDPAPGEPAASSCAIRRENEIRQELGIEPRTTYDLRGLAIGRLLAAAESGGGQPER